MRHTLRKTTNAVLLSLLLTIYSFSVPAQAGAAQAATPPPVAIPEPVTLLLFGIGLAGMLVAAARSRA